MSLNLALILKMEASQAKAELRAVQGEISKTGTSAKGLAADARTAGDGMAAYSAKTAALEAEMLRLALAQTQAATTATAMKPVYAGAAGSVGNMAAQFNDIGVMLAAGQNPLQLAIQQGTQITQIFGGQGAAGAVGMLKAGFMQMISPVNLMTIGVIAGGAALVQWGISAAGAGADAVSLSESIDVLADSVKSYVDASERATMTTAELQQAFGTATPTIRQALIDLANIEKIKAFDALKATSEAMRDLVLDVSMFSDVSGSAAAQDFLGLGNMLSSQRELGRLFEANLETLRRTEDPAVRLRTALDLKAQMESTIGGYTEMNKAQRELFEGLTQIIVEMQTLGIRAEEAKINLSEAQRAALSLARTQIAANIEKAIGPASRLNSLLQAAALAFGRAMALPVTATGSASVGLPKPPVVLGYSGGTGTINLGTSNVGSAGSAGSGGGAARAERDAVADLIIKLREEQEQLQTSDPIKAEMLKYRKELAEAKAILHEHRQVGWAEYCDRERSKRHNY